MEGDKADEANPRPAEWEVWVDALLLGGLLAVIGAILHPERLLSATTPTGGDTPSHYATAVYLREYLLPRGQISGWMPGNYAGFPILQFYFPLPFLLIVALGIVTTFPVAFKLGTILGTVLLPLSAYALMRLLQFRFPTPAVAGGVTVVFLLQCKTSMWGGNLLSTLAGEFAFSLGLSLALLFLGTMWAGLRADRGVIPNAVLLALVGLGHGYTLLFAGFNGLVLVALARDHWKGLRYVTLVYGLAFCLLGFWLLPLLTNLPYTTAFAPPWFIASWTEILPETFWLCVLLACFWTLCLIWQRINSRNNLDVAVIYLWYGVGISAAGYLLGPWLGLVDIRFIPFGQLLLLLIGAAALGELTRRLRFGPVLGLLTMAALIGWSVSQASTLPGWIAWNYSGQEQKPLWSAFREVNRVLTGTANDPRVLYEHSTINNGTGSLRAFESLSLYSGRSTLEGLYLQASPTAPFVFYLQAELSSEASCPFAHVVCTRFNPNLGFRHLRQFNVREIVAVSHQLKQALRARQDVTRIAEIAPYEVYRLDGDAQQFQYVEPLAFEPLLMNSPRWKEIAYQWFRLSDQLDVHLVFPAGVRDAQLARFSSVVPDQLTALPRHPLPLVSEGSVVSRLSADTIEFETPHIGHPHLIKVSYHPNWHVEGAEGIYLVSPSFMLVYPDTSHVRLWYGTGWPERVGMGLTIVGLLGLLLLWWRSPTPDVPRSVSDRSSLLTRLGTVCGLLGAALPVVLLVVAFGLRFVEPVPGVLLNEGIQARDRGDLDSAADRFHRVLAHAPASGAAEQAAYYLAIVQFLRGDMDGTIALFLNMIRVYPFSPFVPEGYYHIGLAHLKSNRPEDARTTFRKVTEEFLETAWARHAQDRLAELSGSPNL